MAPVALLIWFVGNVLAVYLKFGVLDSISRSWYKWLEVKHSWVFTWFCYGLAVGLWWFVGTHEELKIASKLLFSFAGASIAFVGIASNYKETKQTRVDLMHYAFSGLTIGLCLIALWVEGMPLLAISYVLSLAAMIILKAVKKFNNVIWWTEITAFGHIDLGLFLLQQSLNK